MDSSPRNPSSVHGGPERPAGEDVLSPGATRPPTTPLSVEAQTTPESRGARDRAAPPGLERYEIIEEIAHGGMGIVYKARDRVLGRIIALKMIRAGTDAGPEEVCRFLHEAQAIVQLEHPHIIPVHDFGEVGGQPYFTMRLAEGGSLSDHLERFTADPRGAAALMEKVARAVQHAHERGVLHRDLKPPNILLDSAGEPLVVDFGLAKFLHRAVDMTQTGQMLGTPSYMAPEQARGRSDLVGPSTDVWALGVILFELLTGQRPYQGNNREAVLHQIATTPPPAPRSLVPALDPALENILLHCLEPEPALRFASAGELADALAGWLATPPVPRASPRKRIRAFAALAGLAALLVCVTALLLGAGDPDPSKRARPESISLVDNGEPVRAFRWVEGRDDSSLEPEAGVCRLKADRLALVELLPEPPWDSYRLAGEIRHDSDVGLGNVGLALTICSYAGPGQARTCYCAMAFSERRAGFVHFRSCRWHSTVLWQELGQNLPVKLKTDDPRPFRELAVEVRPGEVSFWYEGQCVDRLDTAIIQHSPVGPDKPERVPWEVISRGGLGLMVLKGSASFRHVRVERLP